MATTASAALYERLFPQQYISRFLSNNLRLDNRLLLQYRDITITPNPMGPHVNTSSLVKIGQTEVVATTTYHLGLPSIFDDNAITATTQEKNTKDNLSPDPDHHTESTSSEKNLSRQGQVHLNIISPQTSGVTGIHSRDMKNLLDAIKQQLNDISTQQQWLDLTHLYINQKMVWHVYVDVVINNNDGNLFDAIFLAYQHALLLTMDKYPLVAPQQEKIPQDSHPESDGAQHTDLLTTQIISQQNQLKFLPIDLSAAPDHITTTTATSSLKANPHHVVYAPVIVTKLLLPAQLIIIPIQEVKLTQCDDAHHIDDALQPQDNENNTSKTNYELVDRDVYLLDPSLAEEKYAASTLTMIMDTTGGICFMNKSASHSSSTPFTTATLLHCLQQLGQHCGRISQLLKK